MVAFTYLALVAKNRPYEFLWKGCA